MTIQTSSTTSPTHVWKFDVFLSFRGPDTRNGFTDHLYNELHRGGIKTFRDDRQLERGKTISPELERAIEQSRFLVVILSINYADSTWCLDELAKIVECASQSAGQTVLPVFYNVEPSHVRRQTESFEEHFARHERVFKDSTKKVERWRKAFTGIASIAGWEVNRPESQIIQGIVEKVSRELNGTSSSCVRQSKDFVGMDFHVKAVESDLGLQWDDVRAIGIWGMPGVGKTTLAEFLFERLCDQFKARSFISLGREAFRKHDLLDIQEKLYADLFESQVHMEYVTVGVNKLRNRLRNTKVLIILDGVDQFDQIEALVGKGGEELYDWFGLGSRVIITTRNVSLLKRYEAKIYEVHKLTFNESLLLFCRKAFKQDHFMDDFADLSYKFVDYADGIPLALEVLGGLLFGKNLKQWSDALCRLKHYPNQKIHRALKLSYDGLETPPEKKMFLDIACFFRGQDAERVKRISESCNYYPDIGIEVLIENSLVTIESGKLWMHDLLQEMGKEIARGGYPEEPWKHNRLCDHTDALRVISGSKGTEAVEGFFLIPPHQEKVHLTTDPFSKMDKVKLMKIRNVNFTGCIEYSLSNELRVLEWHGCPLKSMPSSFEPVDIVEIIMPRSRIEQLWKEIGRPLQKLVVIDLSNCEYLTKTPDLSKVPKLERLILKGCKKLSAVHPSIGDLHALTLLNLDGCECLTTLPNSIGLRSLKKFILSGCSTLKRFPEIGANMTQLSELHLDGTALKEVPASIKHLTALVLLNFRDCKNLLNLPDIICTLTSLQSLNLAGCLRMHELPENFGRLNCLKELDVSRTGIRQVLASSGTLLPQNLRQLCFGGCRDLPCYSMLSLFQRWLLPMESSIGLQLLPASLSGLCSLVKLDLSDCNLFEGAIPDDLGCCVPSLQHLDISGNNFVSIPETLSQLPQLKKLELNNCRKLKSLPKLSSSIRHVYARDCSGLRGTYPSQSPFWTRTATGLNMLDFGRHQKSNIPTVDLGRAPRKLLYQKFHEDAMYEGRSFQLEFPDKKSIPTAWLSRPCTGSSIKVPLLPNLNWNSGKFIGFAMYFECGPVLEDSSTSSNTSKEDSDFNCKYFCEFHTDEGPVEGPSIVNEIRHYQNRSAASYGHFLFEPGSWFKEKVLSEGLSFIQASITIDRPEVKVKSCGARLIYEEDVVELVGKLVHFQCNDDDPPDSISQHLKSSPLWGFPTSSLEPEEETTSLELTTFQIEPYNSTEIESQLERKEEALLEGWYPRDNPHGFVMSLRTPDWRGSYQSIGMELAIAVGKYVL